MKIIIIAAISNNNVIGVDGKIPWKSIQDLKFFQETTKYFPVIMGRKTFQSIGRVLSDRVNIVLSNKDIKNPDIIVFNDFQDAISFCKRSKYLKVFIIGGECIYKQSVEFADELIISKFDFTIDGDKYFPEIKENIWKEYNRIDFDDFSVYYYHRK